MDKLEIVTVDFAPIHMPRRLRTTLHRMRCEDCGVQIFARSQDAAVEAAADHAVWSASLARVDASLADPVTIAL